MPKTIAAGLQTHLDGSVTRLAACWEITRTDAQVFRYTSHDQDLVVSGDTYYSVGAPGSESALAGANDMSVDQITLQMLLGTDVTRPHILSGKWDKAEVRLFLVNWSDTSLGTVKMRRGWLGELSLLDVGMDTEFRGLLQSAAQTTGQLYSPACRARFGDARCGLEAGYYEQTFTVLSGGAGSGTSDKMTFLSDVSSLQEVLFPDTVDVTILNPGAESGILGWTPVNDSTADTSLYSDKDAKHRGSYGFRLFGDDQVEAWQDVEVPTAWQSGVDAGRVTANVRWWQKSHGTTPRGALGLDFLDSSDTPLNSAPDVSAYQADEDWRQRSMEDVAVPVGTQQIRISMLGDNGSGPWTLIQFDDIELWLSDDLGGGGGGGYITWDTGNNAGIGSEVASVDPETGAVTLFEPLPYAIEAGDTGTFVPGCDGALSTCKNRYDNVANFRGEPHLPGADVVFQTPPPKK